MMLLFPSLFCFYIVTVDLPGVFAREFLDDEDELGADHWKESLPKVQATSNSCFLC